MQTRLLLLFSILSLGPVLGQKKLNRVEFGVKGGLNISNWIYDDIYAKPLAKDPKSRSALRTHYGIYLKINLSNRVGVQSEALLSDQGDHSTNLTYFNFPVNFYFRVIKEFSIHAGVQKGFLQGSRFRSSTSFYRTDFDYTAGASWNCNNKVSFTVRYIRGLTNVTEENILVGWIKPYAANSVIQFSISYQLKSL